MRLCLLCWLCNYNFHILRNTHFERDDFLVAIAPRVALVGQQNRKASISEAFLVLNVPQVEINYAKASLIAKVYPE